MTGEASNVNTEAHRLHEICTGDIPTAREAFLRAAAMSPHIVRDALEHVVRTKDSARAEALVEACHELGTGTRNKALYHAISVAVDDDHRILSRHAVIRLLCAVNEEARAWKCFQYASQSAEDGLGAESGSMLDLLWDTVRKNRKHSSVYAAAMLLAASNVTARQAHDAAALLSQRMTSCGALPRSLDDFVDCANGMDPDRSRTVMFGRIRIPDMSHAEGGDFYRYPADAWRLRTAAEGALQTVLRRREEHQLWSRLDASEAVQAFADELPENWALSWALLQTRRAAHSNAAPWFPWTARTSLSETDADTAAWSWPCLRSGTAAKILHSVLKSLSEAAKGPVLSRSEPRKPGDVRINGSGPAVMLTGLIAMIHPSALGNSPTAHKLRELTSEAWYLIAPIATQSDIDSDRFRRRPDGGGPLCGLSSVRRGKSAALFSMLSKAAGQSPAECYRVLRFLADEDRHGARRVTLPECLSNGRSTGPLWHAVLPYLPEWAARNINHAITRNGSVPVFAHPATLLSLRLNSDLRHDEVLDAVTVAELSHLANDIICGHGGDRAAQLRHTLWGRITSAAETAGFPPDSCLSILDRIGSGTADGARLRLSEALGAVGVITG